MVGGKAGVTATLVMGESKVLALATHSDSEEVLNITAGSGQKLNNLWRTSSGERLSG